MVKIKRIYAAIAPDDGQRVLVDRLWPRGISKERAALALWLKEIAPSVELRKWFDHEPAKWPEFQKRYRAELRENSAWPTLVTLAQQGTLTLVYAARDEVHNGAAVLKQILDER